MDLTVIETNFGAFLIHSPTCPIIPRDIRQHNKGELATIEATGIKNKEQLVKEIRDALGSTQDLKLFRQRFIYHSLTEHKVDVCVAERLPG